MKIINKYPFRLPFRLESRIRSFLREIPENFLIGLDSIILVDKIVYKDHDDITGMYIPEGRISKSAY